MIEALRTIEWAALGADALLLAILCALLAALQKRSPPTDPEARPEAEPPSAKRKAEREERDAWRILQGYDAATAYGVHPPEAGDGA